MSQRQTFIDGEGDRWFERNRQFLSHGDDAVTEAVVALQRDFRSILEIGASNAHRLDALTRTFDATGAGIDPSRAAVEAGRSAYPDLTLKVATADDLPFTDASFDLVVVGFCFYLVDPVLHFRAVREADRVLDDGGTLIIFDFLAPQPYANDYAHAAGLRSHKMDISRYFTASPGYTLVSRRLKVLGEGVPSVDDRITVDVLTKARTQIS
ncbi:MAG: class I SAM-dependent methyltransferase [Pseudomonadota bacterium]